MPSSISRNWLHVGRTVALAAATARHFLELSPRERLALFTECKAEGVHAYAAEQLAEAIGQARELVLLLEGAEKAWSRAAKERAATPQKRGHTRIERPSVRRAARSAERTQTR